MIYESLRPNSLDYQYLMDTFDNPEYTLLRKPEPKHQDPSLLKDVFQTDEGVSKGTAFIILGDQKYKINFQRAKSYDEKYQSGLLRLFFRSGLQEVTLTATESNLTMARKIDRKEEQIPVCNQGKEIEDPFLPALVFAKRDRSQIRAFRFVDTNRFIEAPIYSRPISTNPLWTPQGEIKPSIPPDISIYDLLAFSQESAAMILNELDPYMSWKEWGIRRKETGEEGIDIKPSLKPAIEIAKMIVENLGLK